jgi:hypothetical protein
VDAEKALSDALKGAIRWKLGQVDAPLEDDLLQLLVRYYNISARITPARPWRVEFSDELNKQLPSLSAPIQAGLELLCAAAKQGLDLRPWLHDGLFSDKQDALWNDWGMQHFHLGAQLELSDACRVRVKRTGELLYAIHRSDQGVLYLIAIFDHKSFSKQQLVEITHRQWPRLIDHARVENLVDISFSPTNSDIHRLRKNQINAAIEVDGVYYLPIGGGMTLSGHSTNAVQWAQHVIRGLHSIVSRVTKPHFVLDGPWICLVDEHEQLQIILRP